MAKRKKKVTITEEQLEKDGVVEFVCKDSYGITYEMKAFRMGYALNGRVLTKDDRLVYHNEFSFDSFELLKLAFERTAETMTNDDHPIHKKHADMAKKMADVRCKKADGRGKREETSAISHQTSSINHHPSSISPQTSNEVSLAERLRQALIKLQAA